MKITKRTATVLVNAVLYTMWECRGLKHAMTEVWGAELTERDREYGRGGPIWREMMRVMRDDLIEVAAGIELSKDNHDMKQIPSVGRVVHYQAFGTPKGEYKSVPRAAIITEVHDAETGDIGVCILNPGGVFFSRVKYSETCEPGCWSWPLFVAPVAK